MERLARLLVWSLVVLGILGLGPISAARAARTASTVQKAEEVAQYVARGAPSAPPTGLNCGPTCSDLWLSEHRPMPNQPASQDLHRELKRLRFRTGVFKGLRFASAALTRVSLVATTFAIGYKIGDGIYAKFIDGGPAPPATVTVQDMYPVESGHLLASWGAWPENVLVSAPYFGFQYETHPGGAAPQLTSTELIPRMAATARPDQCDGAGNTVRAFPDDNGLLWATYENPLGGIGGPIKKGMEGPVYYLESEHLADFSGPTVRSCNPPDSAPPGTIYGHRPFYNWLPRKEYGEMEDFAGQAVTNPIPADQVTDAPFDTNKGGSPSAFKQKVADELDTDDYPVLNQWLDHELGGDSPDPTELMATVPNCTGDSYAECVQKLHDAGFTGTITHQYEDFDGADVTKPAGATISTNPVHGARVETDVAVTVKTNPDDDDMPRVVPEISPHEKISDYLDRLQELGLVGQTKTLSATETDPEHGPDEAVRTRPDGGTRVPKASTVAVDTNPPDAPPATAGPSSDCGLQPPSGSFNTGPLKSIDVGDHVPFNLLPWMEQKVSGLAGDAGRPNASFTVLGTTVSMGFLSHFDGPVGVLRAILAFLLWIGVAWFLYGRTIGSGGE